MRANDCANNGFRSFADFHFLARGKSRSSLNAVVRSFISLTFLPVPPYTDSYYIARIPAARRQQCALLSTRNNAISQTIRQEAILSIATGLKAQASYRVDTLSLADQWGGEAHALASPIMIIFIEQTCMKATDHLLASDLMTVGYYFEIKHQQPTPPEWEVTVDAELIRLDDRMMTYRVTVRDAVGLVGEGLHTRCAVSRDGFHKRLEQRRSKAVLATSET
jgi:fluoroacetyl-CoA thioesterase